MSIVAVVSTLDGVAMSADGRLLDGGRIGFKFTTKAGKESWVEGTMEKQAYKGKPFYGFKADFGKKK